MMRRLQDVEKLKLILLDEEQLVLFNFVKKPMISCNPNLQVNELKGPGIRRTTLKEKAGNEIMKCLEKCRENQESNFVNRRLVEFWDENQFHG